MLLAYATDINITKEIKKSEPQMGFEPTTSRVLDRMLRLVTWMQKLFWNLGSHKQFFWLTFALFLIQLVACWQ